MIAMWDDGGERALQVVADPRMLQRRKPRFRCPPDHHPFIRRLAGCASYVQSN